MNIVDVIRRSKEISQIKQGFNSKSLNHAFLVVCEDNLLSDAFAKCFSEIILDETIKVMAGTHSDVLLYPKNNKQITVADTEEIIEKSILKPIEGENKILILNAIEGINEASQNKLLKIIEEPPKNLFILIQSSFDRSLLPTIRSRVNTIYLSLLSIEQFRVLGFSENDYYKSGGYVSIATMLQKSPEFNNTYEACIKALSVLDGSKDILVCSRKILKKLNVETILTIFTLIFSEIIKQKALNEPSFFADIANKYSLKSLAFIIDKINKAKQKVRFNCNSSAVIDCLLLEILEERYKWQQS